MNKYVVIDLEMCKVRRNSRNSSAFSMGREIIQIGAVILDENFEITDQYDTYVSPQFGAIDTVIENLTGINSKMVCHAPSLSEAIQAFTEWIPADGVTMISWSMTDQNQLFKEMEQKNIDKSGLEKKIKEWEDCQWIFTQKMGASKIYKLSEALIISDICFEDQIHNGLVDAINTSYLFRKINSEEELKLNDFYHKEEQESCLVFSLNNLFSDVFLNDSVACAI